VFAMTRDSGDGKPAEQVAQQGNGAQQPPPPPPKITVEPIAVPEQTTGSDAGSGSGSGSAPEIQFDTPPTSAPTPAPTQKTPHKKPPHDPRRFDHAPPPPAPPPKGDLTRDTVASKFRAVSTEYTAYKAKNGGRLDQQWDDLATFMQFQLRADNLDDAVRRIDAFRAKMRE